jgi:hypothetical protein
VGAPVLAIALSERFASRGERRFADQLISAMRHEFHGNPGRVPVPSRDAPGPAEPGASARDLGGHKEK